MSSKKLIKQKHKQEDTKFAPKKLDKLKLLFVVVKKGHGVAVNELILENGASTSILFYAEGSKDKYVMDIFGGEEKEKECIAAIIPEKNYAAIKERLDIRFTISQASKGIMLAFDVNSMAGVLAYKFLSDFEGAKNYARKK